MGGRLKYIIQPSAATPYDNSTSGIVADNAQDAIDELVVNSGKVRVTTFVGVLSIPVDSKLTVYSNHIGRIQAPLPAMTAQTTTVVGSIATSASGALLVGSGVSLRIEGV